MNFQSEDVDTPLFVAAEHGRASIIHLLLAAKADVRLPSMCDPGRRCPLAAAAARGHAAAAAALLDGGAELDHVDGSGATAEDYARRGDHWELAGVLRQASIEQELLLEAAQADAPAQNAQR